MSGIKDYEYSYTAARKQRLREELQERRQRRAAQTQAKLAESRRRAQERAAETEARLAESRRQAQERAAKEAALRASLEQFQQQRATVTDARLAESRRLAKQSSGSVQAARAAATEAALAERVRETQQAIEALQETIADRPADSHTLSPDVRQAPTPPTADRQTEPTNAAEVTDRITEIEAWRETLAGDEAVQTFQVSEMKAWRDRAEKLLADHTAGVVEQDILARADEIHREATRIHEEAGQRQGKFEARNQLLRDIIDSLKEIGFFVSDPSYQDANDPAGPVALRATRGAEQMTASIDLSETVRSVWNGLEEEHCKSAFWEYMERMKERGVEIAAKRPDLRERPILRQKGALDLPQSGTQRAGG